MSNMPESYFAQYRELTKKADEAFGQVKKNFTDLVRCESGCNDCCFALFEMHPIEAVHLAGALKLALKQNQRCEIQRKANKMADKLDNIKEKLRALELEENSDQRMIALSKERLECPLHAGGTCALYSHRPITCRTYGIPRSIKGKGATCGRSGFEPGKRYPTLNMDILDHCLHELSRALLRNIIKIDPGRRRVLISVADAIIHDLDDRYFLRRLNY